MIDGEWREPLVEVKMTEKEIVEYKKKAERAYNEHCMYCEKILLELFELFPNEKEKINGVIFQSSDGICVIYEELKNIPLLNFLKGARV